MQLLYPKKRTMYTHTKHSVQKKFVIYYLESGIVIRIFQIEERVKLNTAFGFSQTNVAREVGLFCYFSITKI